MPNKPTKYPPHLWTLEFHLDFPTLPVLHHHYGTEDQAREAIQVAQAVMNRSNGAICRLRLWHRNTLQLTLSPNNPTPRPLPPPDSSGVRHLPPISRKIKPLSSLYFNSASLNLVDETDFRL